MTVAELIEKLATLPPSTVVTTDTEYGYGEFPNVYLFRGHVDRRDDGTPAWVHDDNNRDSVELVILITEYGHDDKELL